MEFDRIDSPKAVGFSGFGRARDPFVRCDLVPNERRICPVVIAGNSRPDFIPKSFGGVLWGLTTIQQTETTHSDRNPAML